MNARLRCFCQLGDLAGDAGFLSKTRQHLHRHPELSFQEADTATLVARHLEEWGWAVTRGVGGHGVVGTLKISKGTVEWRPKNHSNGFHLPWQQFSALMQQHGKR